MDKKKFVKQYQQDNASFKKKLVFHLGGSGAGFYSEYNSMIYSMVYCYYHKIQFQLYSKKTKLFNGKGYSLVFENFCYVNDSIFHRYFNKRMADYHSVTASFSISTKEKILLLGEFVYKLFTGKYLTQDVFCTSRLNSFVRKNFDFPTLGIKGGYREVVYAFVNSFYEFNIEYKNKIKEIIAQLELPDSYITMHIRGGDKIIEHDLYEEGRYIELAEQQTNLRTAYLLTDDYSIYESLSAKYPLWKFYTLALKSEDGYNNATFQSLDFSRIDKQMTNLYASVEIIRNSRLFIGTCSSNVGAFIGMIMPADMIQYMDSDEWHIQ